ncbi:MAG: amino acid decarboxylase, partial [Firmicutes bacterium]|nr:amino acid decarboxylase [Bacillota bacterium]
MSNSDFYSDAPLYQALKRYVGREMSSFHTPGHKNSPDILPLDLSFDLTELPATDSLFECDGIIRESEVKAAELFGA